MSTTTFSASVPVFIRMLGNLSHILNKAETHAVEKKITPPALLQARLFPDMFPLIRQVQIACDNAKNGSARIAGVDFPKFDDTESSFAELQERIAKTIAFLNTLTPEQFAANAAAPVVHAIPAINKTYNFANGHDYLTTWVMPNVYFHITTAYAILRHNGVPVGKTDFLAGAAAQ